MQKITDNYPLNIYMQVMELEDDDGDCNRKAVMEALLTLTDREQVVLERRFRFGETLQKTGEGFGVGKERIRQIEVKALRKMRHPSRLRDMRISGIIASRNCLRDRNAELEAVIAEQRTIITELSKQLTKNEREKILDPYLIKINEIDLSVRTFNCMWRAGYNTVEDILKGIESADDLCRIRNLGRKSADELIAKMRELGYSEWAAKITG